MQTQPKASHFIDGQYVEDTAGDVIEVIYPYTGDVIAKLHAATPAIIEQALDSAARAQKEWAAMTGTERGRVLRRAADMMRDRNHDLSVLETFDTGKPFQETSVADATSGADALEYFGGLAYPPGTSGPVRGDRRVELPHADRLLERCARASLRERDGV